MVFLCIEFSVFIISLDKQYVHRDFSLNPEATDLHRGARGSCVINNYNIIILCDRMCSNIPYVL